MFPDWGRTYKGAFHAFAPGAPSPKTVEPVCRAFSRYPSGVNTHRYMTAGDAQGMGCSELLAPSYGGTWIVESYDVFHVDVPDTATGACNPGEVPIYRLMKDGDAGHQRYTTSAQVRADMVARGYTLVPAPVMCGAP